MKPATPFQAAHPGTQRDWQLYLNELEHILRAQLDGERLLMQCVRRKRQAIRFANIGEITSISAGENTVVQRLAQLEKSRLELVGKITAALTPQAAEPMTLNEISELAQEPQRTRLIAVAAQLRDLMTELRRESSIVKQAAETLSRHMSGIVQTVHSALSRARVYGHRGNIALGAQINSMVDIKS